MRWTKCRIENAPYSFPPTDSSVPPNRQWLCNSSRPGPENVALRERKRLEKSGVLRNRDAARHQQRVELLLVAVRNRLGW